MTTGKCQVSPPMLIQLSWWDLHTSCYYISSWSKNEVTFWVFPEAFKATCVFIVVIGGGGGGGVSFLSYGSNLGGLRIAGSGGSLGSQTEL